MKEGTIISREQLESEGWKYVHSFGYCYIYGKGIERILWDPKEMKVVVSYNEQNYVL